MARKPFFKKKAFKAKAPEIKVDRRKADLDLWEVHKHDGISVELGVPRSMCHIGLKVTNDTPALRLMNLTGAVLHPDDNNYQRLFVAGIQGQRLLEVPANSSVEVDLATCCMDEKKEEPDGSVIYKIGKRPAPKELVTAGTSWVKANCDPRIIKTEGPTQRTANPEKKPRAKRRDELDFSKPSSEEVGRRLATAAKLEHVQQVCWGRAEATELDG